MATETTFFSYSRTDSDFVLKLAKDLRDAGAELWLDQLDIKAGSHWDSSIEAALNNAPRLIVILSPASVSSDNVMDEVSYGLETGKTVIPVLLSQCTMPFRLRRLQHIDFTGDYQMGLNQLLEALGKTAGPNLKSKSITQERKLLQTKIADEIPDRDTTEQSGASNNFKDSRVKKGNSKKYMLLGGVVIIIALAIWAAMNLGSDKEGTELKAWNKALQQNDSSAYALYKQNFPTGTYVAQAKDKLDSIAKLTSTSLTSPIKDPIIKENNKDKNTGENESSQLVANTDISPETPQIKKDPFYAIMVAAPKTDREAKARIMMLKRNGFDADYLWIPDYASLSGAQFYAVYIGPYTTQQECEVATEEYRKKHPNAYGLLVSQDRRRVQINGIGKVKVTDTGGQ
ncbi:MAG TPA: TIR domain-containing protein [Chitinophagaceae bacterium]|nr:TIR domain-containing protein [Chitinophagaceae bacterium]